MNLSNDINNNQRLAVTGDEAFDDVRGGFDLVDVDGIVGRDQFQLASKSALA